MTSHLTTDTFNIYDHVTFHTGSTCSSTHLKMKHVLSRTNSARHFYFNRMPRLWNSLPTIDLDQSTGSIKLRVQRFLWFAVLSLIVHVLRITSCALALNAHVYLWCIILQVMSSVDFNFSRSRCFLLLHLLNTFLTYTLTWEWCYITQAVPRVGISVQALVVWQPRPLEWSWHCHC